MCVQAFELLTGRWLFKPQEGEDWSFDDDHLAKMLEFMGANKFQGEWLSHASKRDDFLDPSGKLNLSGLSMLCARGSHYEKNKSF